MTAPSTVSDMIPIRPSGPLRCKSLVEEVWLSTDLLFQNKITWLLVLGPIALFGDATGLLGEAACFVCSGIALIPCAERLVQNGNASSGPSIQKQANQEANQQATKDTRRERQSVLDTVTEGTMDGLLTIIVPGWACLLSVFFSRVPYLGVLYRSFIPHVCCSPLTQVEDYCPYLLLLLLPSRTHTDCRSLQNRWQHTQTERLGRC